MSKYGDVIKQARKPENQAASELVSQQNGKPGPGAQDPGPGRAEEKAEEVNLSIKVAKRFRRHWVSEAKRQDTTLTAVIIDALTARFGEPNES